MDTATDLANTYTTTCDHGKTWSTLDPTDPNACAECVEEDQRHQEQQWRWEAEEDRKQMEHDKQMVEKYGC